MKTRRYCKRLLYILSLTFCILGQSYLICPTASGVDLEVSTSGKFIPMMELKNSDASLATGQWAVEFSAGILDLEYTMTSFSWNTISALPFGNGRNIPWHRLHEVSTEARHQAKLNDTWGYLGRITGGAAFEENIDDAYLKAKVLGGVRYTLWDDRFYLMAGGGMKIDDFKTSWGPAGGFEWRIGYGFKLSFIYPVESELSFTSENDTLSVDINVMNGHTNIEYAFTPELSMSFSYDDADTFYRLSKDSVVEPSHEKTYLEAKDRLVRLGLRYSPLRNLTCDAGVAYNFDRNLELSDDNKNSLQQYKIDPSVGGTFGISYQF